MSISMRQKLFVQEMSKQCIILKVNHDHIYILGHPFCFVDLESQVRGPGSWVLVSRPLVESLKSCVAGYRSGSLVWTHSVIITKCNIKLLQSVGGITQCDSYYKVT